jgi:phosphoglycerol transferase MdoB-like AlkP superfamily enzyme
MLSRFYGPAKYIYLCGPAGMRTYLALFIKLYIWWLLYFAGARLFFLLFHLDRAADLLSEEWVKIFWLGMQMDLSMSGYFMIAAGLLICVSLWFGKNLLPAVHVLNLALIVLSSFMVVADAELYRHWGFRLTTAPLLYLDTEAAGTLPTARYAMLILLWLLMCTFWIYSYLRLSGSHNLAVQSPRRRYALTMFVITALLIIPIRGSFQVSTMNVSRVYFHPYKPFANHAGINVVWNFLYSATRNKALKYPEDFFDAALTDKYFNELYPRQDSTASVLSTKKPNILLIILEGITADVVEPLGGLPGIMPNLNRLCSEGLLFERFYANGDRTDKGLVSLLAAYPAQPRGSIIKYNSKTEKLQYLSAALVKLGYQASFVYGGDVDFANYKSLFTNGKFSHITSLDDFPDSIPTNKWGVHDAYLYARLLQELNATDVFPFFKVALTLSSHEPFNVPLQDVFPGDDDATRYLNAAYYADRCLGEFIKAAQNSSWWHNTLVIITADHGHRLPKDRQPEQPEKYHIPMIWTGGAVSGRKTVPLFGNQTDLANTLLAQIDAPDRRFLFSKNLLGAPVSNFAVFVFNEGYGFITPETTLVYDFTSHTFIKSVGNVTERDVHHSKAYMQKLFFDYNAKK